MLSLAVSDVFVGMTMVLIGKFLMAKRSSRAPSEPRTMRRAHLGSALAVMGILFALMGVVGIVGVMEWISRTATAVGQTGIALVAAAVAVRFGFKTGRMK